MIYPSKQATLSKAFQTRQTLQTRCVANLIISSYIQTVRTTMVMEIQNANPTVYQQLKEREIIPEEENEDVHDLIDSREIFDLIRYINDPEHPLTLEQLNVIEEKNISIDDEHNSLTIYFTPTIPHCSMATLIGLSIRVLLLRSLPARFKVDIMISPGTHVSEQAVNKQLGDKERVAAALENSHLLQVINQCVAKKK